MTAYNWSSVLQMSLQKFFIMGWKVKPKILLSDTLRCVSFPLLCHCKYLGSLDGENTRTLLRTLQYRYNPEYFLMEVNLMFRVTKRVLSHKGFTGEYHDMNKQFWSIFFLVFLFLVFEKWD